MPRWTWPLALSLAPLLFAGCARNGPPPVSQKPPEVKVGLPVVRAVTDYEIFTGRVEASERVEIRARVTGYLERQSESNFTEGGVVEKGALLFVIDPRPYRAELARAEASLAQARARLARLEGDFERGRILIGRQAMSREEFDRIAGDRDEARGGIGLAESNVKLAELNLEYTEVRTPFTGRVSRRLVDPGNLVKADETILTTLVSLKPLYIYFDVDERTLLRELLQEGLLESAQEERLPVRIGLSDEEGYPHAGIVNFVDNRADPNTGTMWLRAELVSPKRPIKPGIFGRVHFPLGDAYEAVLVAEQALGTDQGQKFVYVVNEKNQAVYRAVKVGRLHGGLRVVHEGLKPGERIVVTGLQRVRPNAEVTPAGTDMEGLAARPPSRESDAGGSPASGRSAAKRPMEPTPAAPARPAALRPGAKTEAGS